MFFFSNSAIMICLFPGSPLDRQHAYRESPSETVQRAIRPMGKLAVDH